ncbi:hypothetical protein [Streptomyces thermodiastaticus]|nr:hypothetical protein [Streptomyces thermodiastaticus]
MAHRLQGRGHASPYFQATEASEQPTWNQDTFMCEGGSHTP